MADLPAVADVDAEMGVAEPEQPVAAPRKPRLIIKEIELTNFKSYGGTRTIGPFHTKFSCVVGPNGSGKSNTIDALLFVFGKRAKKIRLNKVSELIHSSVKIEPPKSAKVTVYFAEVVDLEDGESTAEVPGSQFNVGREAFKDNSSKYRLNGKGSNFHEVTTLLREKGIDLEHNRFLILQGEVEQISLMKPKAQTEHEEGLLEYLEDLIGTHRFREPIDAAQTLLEGVSEERQSSLSRLRAAEREKDALEGPKREAEEYVRAEAQHLEQRARLAQLERLHGSKALEEAQAAVQVAQTKLAEVRAVLEEERKETVAVEKEAAAKGKDLQKAKVDMEKKRLKFSKYEEEDTKLTEDQKFNEHKLKKLDAVVKGERKKAERLKEVAEDLRATLPNGEEAVKVAEKELEKAEQALEVILKKIRSETEGLGQLKDAEEKALSKVKKTHNAAKQEFDLAVVEARAITCRQDALVKQRQELEDGFASATQKHTARKAELGDLKNNLKGMEEDFKTAQHTVVACEQTQLQLSDQLKKSRTELEAARISVQQAQTRSKLVRAVMSAAKQGELHGVHGRLGDLGTIPDKYDCAITSACGALDNLVVDTVPDGEAVVEFCRERHLGRTTVMIQEKMKPRKLNPDSPEGLPRLVDLVQCKSPAYRIAFEHALGDTLVAENLDQATRVGMYGKGGRRRVVTLDGNLVEASGAMTGGGSQPQRGGMKSVGVSDVTQDDMQKMQEKCEDLSAQLKQAQTDRQKTESQVKGAERRWRDAEKTILKHDLEVKSLAELKSNQQKRLAEMPKAELTDAEKKALVGAEKVVERTRAELETVDAKCRVHEDKIAEIQQQISNAGGKDLQDKKQVVAAGKDKVKEISAEVMKKRVEAESSAKNADRALKVAEKAEGERDRTQKTLLALEQQRVKLDKDAEVVLHAFQHQRGVVDEMQAEVDKLEARRDELQKHQSAARNAEVEANNVYETKVQLLQKEEDRVKQSAKLLKEVRKEYKDMQIHLLEDQTGVEEEISAVKEDLTKEVLATLNPRDIEARMMTLEGNLAQMKPNLQVIHEYKGKLEAFQGKKAEFESINAERDAKRSELDVLKAQRLDEFMAGFNVIAMKLKEMYQMLTLGGDAELELVDTLDPFSEGIHFTVRPPKKSWKQIQNLSGGEKTLSSLALVFALHHYKPTPLYFMDEIDAALDFRNVSIIANYIKDRTQNAQFIVISLRNHMFELADRLLGIYKTHDVSKSVAISTSCFGPLQDADAKLNANAASMKDR